MGQIDKNLEQHQVGHFGFSATRLPALLSPEYTLVTIAVDRSGSTLGFQTQMESTLKKIVSACAMSPRHDSLLIRVVAFASQTVELHGFKLLSEINVDDYDGVLKAGGTTVLYDASCDAIEAMSHYGKLLTEKDYTVNGIVFIMTDGEDMGSKYSVKEVAKNLDSVVANEDLESLISVLIGINIQDPYMKNKLDEFNVQAGFTGFMCFSDAEEKSLAKIAQFTSQSISSQSQALGSGGPSRSIVF